MDLGAALDIVMKYDIEVDARPAASTSGTIKATLKWLAPAATKPSPSREVIR